eukprot:360285-Chlamydomonas_euryale.AAC.2
MLHPTEAHLTYVAPNRSTPDGRTPNRRTPPYLRHRAGRQVDVHVPVERSGRPRRCGQYGPRRAPARGSAPAAAVNTAVEQRRGECRRRGGADAAAVGAVPETAAGVELRRRQRRRRRLPSRLRCRFHGRVRLRTAAAATIPSGRHHRYRRETWLRQTQLPRVRSDPCHGQVRRLLQNLAQLPGQRQPTVAACGANDGRGLGVMVWLYWCERRQGAR